MDESILRRVNTGLNAKFYATNNTWLRDCVEYYLSEHSNPTHAEVLEFVISQWQLSDLREISNEMPCLPKNLAQGKCTTLRGHFVLQLEKLYDISESKYKQLEKIRNVSDDNIQVTESEKTQSWEPNKKRMLHLHLTDGVQNVTAIEYQPIRFLHPNLLPGYKLMIKGPVTCRRGVILLDETNVSGIGGEVENLLVPNALENVLARALNLEENPDPYSDNIQAAVPEDVLFDDDFDIDMEDVALIELQSVERASALSSRDRSNDADSVRVPDEPVNRRVEVSHEINQLPPVPFNQRTESDMLFDMIDDRIFDSVMESTSKTASDSGTSGKVPKQFVPRESDFIDDDQDHSGPVIIDTKTSSSRITEAPSATVENTCRENYMELTRQLSFETRPACGPSTDTSISNIDSGNMRETLPIKQPSNSVMKLTDRPEAKETTQTGSKRSASVLSSPLPNPPAGKVRCTQVTPKLCKTNRKITDFVTKDNPREAATSAAETHDCICDLLRPIDTNTAVQYKTVRGRLTNIGTLSRNGQCWELSATITDCTGNMDVAFSSQILERLLGFTVAEFSQKKKLKKNNPEIERQLRQGLKSAESKVTNLNALLKIELAPNKKPKVVEIVEEY